jgi:lipoprotein
MKGFVMVMKKVIIFVLSVLLISCSSIGIDYSPLSNSGRVSVSGTGGGYINVGF